MGGKKQLVIIGASGHGKVVADIALRCGYRDIAFLDDDDRIDECAGFPVIGGTSMASEAAKASDIVVAIGNAAVRRHIQESVGDAAVTLVHPSASVSRRVLIGKGAVVMAGAVINSDAVIGDGCIVNTGATVDHDCSVGSYAHISVGAHLAGAVDIGAGSWIGIGAVVSNNVSICGGCMVGAGAVVVSDILEPGTYVGVPARRISNGQ